MRSRRRRRALWIDRILHAAAIAWEGLFVTVALAACKPQPVEIRIKGPKEAVESTQANPTFAPFEKKDDTLQLRASAFDSRKRYMGTVPVRWESSDRTVATVSQSGLVTFLSSGKVKVGAKTTETDVPLEASLDLEAIIVKDIRIVDPPKDQPAPIEMPMGEIKQFKAEVLNDRDQVIPDGKIDWRASSWAVTVTPTGEVEARAIGTAQVVAEADNGAVARVDINVVDWKKKK
jgi:hypothetical protein